MPKILAVDRDRDALATLTRELKEAGYEVKGADSSSFALTMLEWDRPDLIVSQAQIDDMDGYELCSVIRSDPKTKDIRFLLLVGPSGPTPGAAARAGMDMVLGGDFNPSDVVGSVKRLV